MKGKIKFGIFIMLLLICSTMCGLGYIGYKAYIYQNSKKVEDKYSIMVRKNYTTFVGDSFSLKPFLMNDYGEKVDGNFYYEYDEQYVEVSDDGIVNVKSVKTNTTTIKIIERKTNLSTEVTLSIINDLYDVFEIRDSNNKVVNSEEQYLYGNEYEYTISVLPKEVELSEFTTIECVDLSEKNNNALSFSIINNRIKVSVKGIGKGCFDVKIKNNKHNVEFIQRIEFSSSFEDKELTNAILGSVENKSLLNQEDINNIERIVFKDNISSISLEEVKYLQSLKTIVFESNTLVSVTSNIPEDIIFRVKKNVFYNYYQSTKWQKVADNIIPYENDYQEIFIVYHTDDKHKVEGFDEKNILILPYNNELLRSETTGYTFNGWYNKQNQKITEKNFASIHDGIHLYADWQVNNYTIIFEDYNGRKNAQCEYLSQIGDILDYKPEKAGWTFVGWYYDEQYDQEVSKEDYYNTADNMTIYAKYITNVTLNYDELKDQESIIDVIYGKNITLPSEVDSVDGWEFNGWYTTQNGYLGQKILSDSAYVVEEEAQMLYAQWICKIEYNFDRTVAESIKQHSSTNLDELTYTYIRNLTIAQSNELTNDKLFLQDEFRDIGSYTGWDIEGLYLENGEAIDYQNEKFDSPNTKLTAKFISTYKILYKQEHTLQTETKSVILGETIYLFNYTDNKIEPNKYNDEIGYEFDCIKDLTTNTEYHKEDTQGIVFTFEMANREYEVKYTLKHYTITFKYEDGETYTTKEYTHENRIIDVPLFENKLIHNGYIGKWVYNNTDKKGQSIAMAEKYEIPSDLYENIEFIADYIANEYKVKFMCYNNDFLQKDDGTPYEIIVTYNEAINLQDLDGATNALKDFNIPTGYTFLEWVTEDGIKWTNDKIFTYEHDIILHAKYYIDINFHMFMKINEDLSGFDRENDNTFSGRFIYGEPMNFPENFNIDKAYWEFQGWANSVDNLYNGLNQKEEYWITENFTQYISSCNEYFAVWTRTINFEINDALIDDDNSIQINSNNILVVYGTTFQKICEVTNTNIFTDDFFEKKGVGKNWEFAGWYVTIDDEKIIVDPDENYFEQDQDTNDIQILYASFKSSVTFKHLEDKEVQKNICLGDNLKQLLDLVNVDFISLVKKGYLLGWQSNSKQYNDENVSDNSAIDISFGKMTLEMIEYPSQYKVKYNSNGGIGSIDDSTFTYDSESNLPSARNLSRKGYKFVGWSLSKDSLKAEYLDEASTMVDGNNVFYRENEEITLYAVWEALNYKVKYNSNGGTGSIDDSTFTYDSESNLPSARNLSRKGYKFVGWSLSKDSLKAEYLDEAPTMVDGNNVFYRENEEITLYAVWEAIKYTIKYELGINDLEAEIEVSYDNKDKIFSSVYCPGYEFKYWIMKNEENRKYNAGDLIPSGDDAFTTQDNDIIELVAVWDNLSFEVEYFNNLEESVAKILYQLQDWEIQGSYTYKVLDNQYIIYMLNVDNCDERLYKPYLDIAKNEKEGYIYEWNLNILKEKVIEYLTSDVVSTLEKVNIHAVWTPIPYQIEYILKDICVKSITYTIEDINSDIDSFINKLLLSAPSIDDIEINMTGFEMIGWNAENFKNALENHILGNYKIYANLTAKEYTIFFADEKGNKIENSESVKFTLLDEVITLPENVAKLEKFFFWDLSINNLQDKIEKFENEHTQDAEKEIIITGKLKTYLLQYVTSQQTLNYVYTYNNLLKKENGYFYKLDVTVNNMKFIVSDELLKDFTLITLDDLTIPFDGHNVIVYGLLENEKLYIYDGNGGSIFSEEDNSLVSKKAIILDQSQFSKANVSAYYQDHTFERWEETETNENIINIKAIWKVKEDDQTYTIHFKDVDGNDIYNSITLKYGEPLDLSTVKIAKKGYTFIGWYLDNTFVTEFKSVTDDLLNKCDFNLYAKWEENTYNIKFDLGYDDKIIEAKNLQYSGIYTLNKKFFKDHNLDFEYTRIGYEFVYWYDSLNDKIYGMNSEIQGLSSINGATITLTAYWYPSSLDKYYIEYKDSTGRYILPTTIIDSIQEKVTIDIPTKEGYRFVQWYYGANQILNIESSQEVDFSTLFGNERICRLFIGENSWTPIDYKISFFNNPQIDNQIWNIDNYSTYVVPENLIAPQRLGYKVLWKMPDFVCHDIVVYPEYLPIKYNIEYKDSTFGVLKSSSIYYDNTSEIFENISNFDYDFDISNKKFIGWKYNNQIYSVGQIIPNLTSIEGSTITLEAVWEDFKIIFIDDNSNILLSITKTNEIVDKLKNNEVLPITPQIPNRDGYIGYWDIVLEDRDVYLQYKYSPIAYYVEFYDNQDLITTIVIAYGIKAKAIDYAKEGYTLLGWSTEENSIDNIIFDISNLTTENNAIVKLYALWSSNKYYIEYNLNYVGPNILDKQEVFYNEQFDLLQPQRKGYIFNGWYKDSNCSDIEKWTLETYEIADNIVLYASWTAIKYDISFNTDGYEYDEFKKSKTVSYDENIILPKISADANSGYIFKGWKINGVEYLFDYNNSDIQVSNLTSIAGETVEIYAIWDLIEYEIQFYDSYGTPYQECKSLIWTVKHNDTFKFPQFSGSNYFWSLCPNGQDDEKAYEPINLSPEIFDENKVLKLYMHMRNDFKFYITIIYCGNSTTDIINQMSLVIKDKSENGYTIDLLNVPYHDGYIGTYKLEYVSNSDIQVKVDNVNNQIIVNSSNKDETAEFTIYLLTEYTAINYTIEFINEGVLLTDYTIEHISYETNLDKLPILEREGYIFKGWKYQDILYYDNILEPLSNINGDVVRLIAEWTPITYTIEYYYDDGTSPENGGQPGEFISRTDNIHYDQNVELLKEINKVKEGYIFAGWYCYSPLESHYYGKKIAKDQTILNLTYENEGVVKLIAEWIPITYIVEYISNDVVIDKKIYSYDDKIDYVPVVNNLGYKLDYWKLENGEKIILGVTNKLTNKQDGVVKILAEWLPIEYKVEYYNGNTMVHSQQVLFGNDVEVFYSDVEAPKGYALMGWLCTDTNTIYNPNDIVNDLTYHEGTIKLYAVWDIVYYIVRFFNNEGEIIAETTYTEADKNIIYPELPEGYEYWILEEMVGNLTNAKPGRNEQYATYYSENGEIIAIKNITGLSKDQIISEMFMPCPKKIGYDASWTINEDLSTTNNYVVELNYILHTYKISFVNFSGETIYETTYTVMDYNFKSPNVPTDYFCNKHQTYEHADRYIISWEEVHLTYGDIVIKPIAIAKKYKITFKYLKDQNHNVEDKNNYENYYEFYDWYTDEDDYAFPQVPEVNFTYKKKEWANTDTSNPNNELTYAEDMILRANYSSNSYTVYYYRNENVPSEPLSIQSIDSGDGSSLYMEDFLGYTHLNWYCYLNGKKWIVKDTGYIDDPQSQKALNALTDEDGAEINLYKEEKVHEYTIKYVDNLESSIEKEFKITYNPTLIITIKLINDKEINFAHIGHTFLNWQRESKGVGDKEYYDAGTSIPIDEFLGDLAKSDNEVITFYAKWRTNVYTIRYNTSGAKSYAGPSEQRVNYGETFEIPVGPTYTGKEFTYWEDNASQKQYNANTSWSNLTTIDGDVIELIACWKWIDYKVNRENGTNGSQVNISGLDLNKSYHYNEKVECTITLNDGYNTLSVTFKKNDGAEIKNPDLVKNGNTYSFNMPASNVTITVSCKKNSCFAKGTMLSLIDGNKVAVENLKIGDKILAFDHNTGQYVESVIAYTYCEYGEVNIIDLYFTNNVNVTLLNDGHGLFDLTLGKYVLITADNVSSFVGHSFSYTEYSNGSWLIKKVELLSYKLSCDKVERYDIVTEQTLNHVINGLLACSDVLVPVCNTFDFDENMKYDIEKMEKDIEKYGLFSYDEWSEYISYEDFVKFNGGYFKIAIGKGLITMDDIFELLEDLENCWNKYK